MKKQTLLLICCLLLSSGIFAQTSIGLVATYGKSWQDYGDGYFSSVENRRTNDYSLALAIYYAIKPNLSIGIEPGLNGRAYANLPGAIWQNVYLQHDLTLYGQYLQLPLFVRGEVNLGRKGLFLYGKLGAGPSYMIKGNRKTNFWDETFEDQRQEINFKEEETLNRMDLGAFGGLGVGFRIGRGAIQLGSNYYQGLLNADDRGPSLYRSLQFGLGYQVKL